MKNKKQTEIFMRNFIFGVEDSLVSTVGLLSGIAVGGVSKTDIFLTGLVLILVEAFSMGVGSFLSEDTTEDSTTKKMEKTSSIVGAVIMFISYFVAGLLPLTPYLFFSLQNAFIFSNIFSLIALFALGIVSAWKYKRSMFKLGAKMFIMGGLAILVGIIVGKFVQTSVLR